MESNKPKLIIVTITILIALSLVSIVLFNLNKNKELSLPNKISLNDVQMIFSANTLDEMNDVLRIGNISKHLSNNIDDFKSIKKVLLSTKKDSVSYSKIMNQHTYIATYTNGDWIILIDTKNTPKISSADFKTGHEEGYYFIEPKNTKHLVNADIDNNLLSVKEKNKVSDMLLCHDNNSHFFIIERILVEDDVTWACHDFFFNDDIQIVSFYDNNSKISKGIKNNPSLVVNAFRANSPKYKYSSENSKATSWIIAQIIASENDSLSDDELLNDSTLVENIPLDNDPINSEVVTQQDKIVDSQSNKNPDAIFTTQKPVIAGPFVVKSHKNEGGFFIQTSDNYLHFIDLNGKSKWKISLDSKLIGNIDEVDWYDNKKIQYMFNTKTRLYLVDVLGNSVKLFPLSLPVHSENKIAIIKNKNDDFNIYYNGIDKAFYYMAYRNNDFTIQNKIANVGSVSTPYQILYDKKIPYIFVQKDDKTIKMFKLNGSLIADITKNIHNNIYSPIYNNNLNNKGLFITGDESGNITYITKSGSISYTSIKEFSKPTIMYFESFNNSLKDKKFFFITNNKIEAITPLKKNIFSANLDISSYTETDLASFNNQIVFTIFSSIEKKANVIRYYKNGKMINNSYSSSTMPAVSDKDVFLLDGNDIIKK